MKIQAINTQSFCAKKFMVPIGTIFVKDNGFTKEHKCLAKEYSNPNAQKLWNQALEESDINKKLNLLNAMGQYKIVDINQEKILSEISTKRKKK